MSNELQPCRDAFEAWFSDPKFPRAITRSGDSYKLMQAHSAWQAWKAAWNHRTPRCGNCLNPEDINLIHIAGCTLDCEAEATLERYKMDLDPANLESVTNYSTWLQATADKLLALAELKMNNSTPDRARQNGYIGEQR